MEYINPHILKTSRGEWFIYTKAGKERKLRDIRFRIPRYRVPLKVEYALSMVNLLSDSGFINSPKITVSMKDEKEYVALLVANDMDVKLSAVGSNKLEAYNFAAYCYLNRLLEIDMMQCEALPLTEEEAKDPSRNLI